MFDHPDNRAAGTVHALQERSDESCLERIIRDRLLDDPELTPEEEPKTAVGAAKQALREAIGATHIDTLKFNYYAHSVALVLHELYRAQQKLDAIKRTFERDEP